MEGVELSMVVNEDATAGWKREWPYNGMVLDCLYYIFPTFTALYSTAVGYTALIAVLFFTLFYTLLGLNGDFNVG